MFHRIWMQPFKIPRFLAFMIIFKIIIVRFILTNEEENLTVIFNDDCRFDLRANAEAASSVCASVRGGRVVSLNALCSRDLIKQRGYFIQTSSDTS